MQRHMNAPPLSRGAYNPDTSRKISRLPPYMEIILESERHKMIGWRQRGPGGSQADWCISSVRRWSHHVRLSLQRALFSTSRRVSQEYTGGVGGGFGSNSGVPSNEELVEEGKVLCREYINHRLRRSGVLAQRQLEFLGLGASSEASEELCLVGEELEAMYPDLFKNVHRQLNLASHSEEVVRRAFALFAEQLCRGGIHWGKIVALFAMAGAFAVDCAGHGHGDYSQRIVDAFGAFVSARLCDWLAQQGGWMITEVTRSNKAREDRTGVWIAASLSVLTVLVFVLLFA